MASNQRFKMKVKNDSGTYTNLLPKTKQSQVLGWSIGETYGPFTFVLKKENWINYEQVIDFKGVSSSDIIACMKVLSGTKEEMIRQDQAYSKIKHVGGIESLNNAIKFVCNEIPEIDVQIQVWWTK